MTEYLFPQKFATEARLQQSILELLARIPGVSNIQLLQGPLEKGKDIVFRFTGPMGESMNYACIVKNTPITGKVSSAGAAHIVLQQARQALSTRYTDNAGTDTRVHRVLVVTPLHITPSAIESISGELSERAGQINFISGEELIRLFQQYWPDFLADEAAMLFRYVESAERSLGEQPEMARISKLYPAADVGEIARFHYVPADFRFVLRTYDLERLFPLLPEEESYKIPLSAQELDDIRRQAETILPRLHHLVVWEYLPSASYQDLVVEVNSFRNLLHRSWEDSQLITQDLGGEKRRVLLYQYDLIMSSREIIRLAKIGINKLSKHLRDGLRLESGRTTDEIGFPHESALLKYIHASSCLDDLGRLGESDEESRHIVREFRMSREQVMSYQGILLVVAPVGYGKTSLCRWSALEDLRLWRSEVVKRIPIYVRLNTLSNRMPHDEGALVREGLHTVLLNESDWRAIFSSRTPVRLYLDGLDELPAEEDRRQIVALARDLAKKNPHWQILLTGRDYIRGNWLKNIPRIALVGFEENHIQQLSERLLNGSAHGSTEFMNQITKDRKLFDLCQVPLLATLMILIFRSVGDLPSRRSILYATFIDLLCGGWDLAKRVQRSVLFGREVKTAVLIRLAWTVHNAGTIFIEPAVFKEVCLRAAPGMFAAHGGEQRHNHVGNFLQEVLVDGLLKRTGETLQFSHISFQEFLAARAIAHDPHRVSSIIENYLKGDDWWREVLFFYLGSVADPEMLAEMMSNWAGKGYEIRLSRLFDELKRAYPGMLSTPN